MNVISAEALTAAVATAASGAATEAGRQAWESLLTLWRRVRGTRAIDPAQDPSDTEQVKALTGEVIQESQHNPAFAGQLTQWAQQFGLSVENDHSTTRNTIADNAHVNGPLIQARDISGPLSFGN
jgi:hypothetical protein